MLALPHDGLFVLDTDASDVAVGVVLSQVQDGIERVIAYYSRLYAETKVNYCAPYKELLVVVEVLRQFRPSLRRHCANKTTHAALRWFWWAPDLVGQSRWIDFLGEFDFEIA